MDEQQDAEMLSPLVRTHFEDESAWASLCAAVEAMTEDQREGLLQMNAMYEAIGQPPLGGGPLMHCISDAAHAGAEPDSLRGIVMPSHPHAAVLAVADARALTEEGFPILFVGEAGETPFRVVAAFAHNVDMNLLSGNLLWEEFVEQAGEDGVIRGDGG